ncbi:hypothetical protein ACFWN7_02795 [Agromyces sp. NPDC058484]|uniref:hypothetical protein n=1 Tax=Agromyces sp. NPDC058484 TaxID=3346524 RepID=UPI003669061D
MTALVARPEALELHDAGGTVVGSLEYAGSVDEALAALTAVLGGPPEEEPYDAGNHNAAGVMHIWDDALKVDEIHYGEGVARLGDATVGAPDFRVYFDQVEVRGKELVTRDGVHVGDAFDALGDRIDPDLWTCSGWAVEHVEVPDPQVGAAKYGVGLSEWEWDETAQNYGTQVDYVASVSAPVSVASGCV